MTVGMIESYPKFEMLAFCRVVGGGQGMWCGNGVWHG
jgi:hypothetical protein